MFCWNITTVTAATPHPGRGRSGPQIFPHFFTALTFWEPARGWRKDTGKAQSG